MTGDLNNTIAHFKAEVLNNRNSAKHIRAVMKSDTALHNAVVYDECAEDYEQFVLWLTELRDIRKVVKDWKDGKIDCVMPMSKAFGMILKIIEKSEE